jgi:hypothetical protein
MTYSQQRRNLLRQGRVTGIVRRAPSGPVARLSLSRPGAEAGRRRGVSGATFPDGCSWTIEQIVDDGFWPG